MKKKYNSDSLKLKVLILDKREVKAGTLRPLYQDSRRSLIILSVYCIYEAFSPSYLPEGYCQIEPKDLAVTCSGINCTYWIKTQNLLSRFSFS